MGKRSKRYLALLEKVDRTKAYPLMEAIKLAKETATAKFEESIDMHVKLNLKSGQSIRDSITLPYSIGKKVRVLVLTKGEKVKEAQEAGADYVGLQEYIDKIKEGWDEFDVVIATPDVMKEVSKLGPILGRTKKMPSPKSGTVTFDIAQTVKEIKESKRVEIRSDKTGNVHVTLGKKSMPVEHLYANAIVVYKSILRNIPPEFKGPFVRSVYISATMGPGIKVDLKKLDEEAAHISI